MPNFPLTWFNVADGAIGELSAEINASVTSLVLKSGNGATFPASDFVVKCGRERIHVSSRTTDTFNTLTRGYDGSTAAIHVVDSPVYQAADRSLFQRIYDQIDGHTHNKSDIPDIEHSITGTEHSFPGGSTFLRADGTFASPAGGGEAFPVGSVFIAVVSTNPGTLLGYGTWSAFGAGRVLVGLDSGDVDFDAAEETGGAKTVTLTQAQMPAHVHGELAPTGASGGALRFAVDTNASGSVAAGLNTASTGGGGAHSNVQPYIVCYFWKRTA